MVKDIKIINPVYEDLELSESDKSDDEFDNE